MNCYFHIVVQVQWIRTNIYNFIIFQFFNSHFEIIGPHYEKVFKDNIYGSFLFLFFVLYASNHDAIDYMQIRKIIY